MSEFYDLIRSRKSVRMYDGRKYHFYLKHDRGFVSDAVGDMQKIDMGIALLHFVLGVKEAGHSAEVSVSDPGIALPDDTEYIATVGI